MIHLEILSQADTKDVLNKYTDSETQITERIVESPLNIHRNNSNSQVNYEGNNCSNQSKIIINLYMLNIQCLTQPKLIEIENNIDDTDIYFLLETHEKRKQTRMKPNNEQLLKMREINYKKRCGIMLIWKRSERKRIEEIKTKHSHIVLNKLYIGKN